MSLARLPLITKLFAAIGLTAMLVVVTMALLVASSMREGFAQYLLKGELLQLEGLVEALAQSHDLQNPGWPEFRNDPRRWTDFTIRHSGPDARTVPELMAPPPPVAIGERLTLLGADGTYIAGQRAHAAVHELVPIPALDAAAGDAPLGWLEFSAPGGLQSETDAFYLRGQLNSLILAAIIATALSAIAAYVLARQFLAPIRALETGARRLAKGNYAARIPNTRSDELGRLIDHYNDLAGSLEAAEIAEKQWISDTSHELQTPLAVLRANIEAIQDGVREPDERTLRAMHSAVERLTRLVKDLRILSDGREDGFVALRRNTDVAALVHEACDSAHSRFAEAGLQLEESVAGPMIVQCDPHRMRQVIDNLLENSLRYTDAPGRVRIAAWRDAGEVLLLVEDTAPAPPKASMPHLFERFHRGETSRSRALGGSGLGLAICKTIVEAHGGAIAATVSELGGLRVVVTLPAKEPT
ncbi:ATP-binding protein [Phaeovulum sp.]|uniref:ATP-binding protein n=1 Tax=Phaeovulum sp. TaxID=2934796 RepID=UPI003567CF5C